MFYARSTSAEQTVMWTMSNEICAHLRHPRRPTCHTWRSAYVPAITFASSANCCQIDADCHCNPMCVFGWFVSLGAREVTLPPDACIWVGLSLGPPDACILGRFVIGRCVVGRARSDPAPPPPQPARCVYLGWFCPRSGIDLIHYLRRKRLQLTDVRWYEMVI